MGSKYVDLKRIEFVVTHSCSGKCKHCSVADSETTNGSIDADAAVNLIKKLSARYAIESVMTFGGEPLLYADAVCKIHASARDCGIAGRQVITNGYFSRNEQKIENVAAALSTSGASISLSVDAFHQEYIPIEPVIQFAESLIKNGIPKLCVHPAWLVNEQHPNPYNDETKRLLKRFHDKGIESSNGNNIFPAGNALKYLSDYFSRPEDVDLTVPCGQMPYTSRLDEISCVSVHPNGDFYLCSFAIGNVYKDDVLHILDAYDPYKNPATRSLMEGGAEKLLDYAEELGVTLDTQDCFTACGVCRKIMTALKEREYI